MVKLCKQCKLEKPEKGFYGFICKDCKNLNRRLFYKNHGEIADAIMKSHGKAVVSQLKDLT